MTKSDATCYRPPWHVTLQLSANASKLGPPLLPALQRRGPQRPRPQTGPHSEQRKNWCFRQPGVGGDSSAISHITCPSQQFQCPCAQCNIAPVFPHHKSFCRLSLRSLHSVFLRHWPKQKDKVLCKNNWIQCHPFLVCLSNNHKNPENTVFKNASKSRFETLNFILNNV